MKIYTYKNGEKAVFEYNKKITFNADEYKALFIPVSFSEPDCTTLYWYLQEKIRIQRNNRYVAILFSEILAEFRANKYETKTFEKEIKSKIHKGTLTYENGELILVEVSEPREVFSYKGLKTFDSALEFVKINNLV